MTVGQDGRYAHYADWQGPGGSPRRLSPPVLSIVDPSVDPGPPGRRTLIELGRRVGTTAADRRALEDAAAKIGMEAAIDAAAVAANFQIMNRVVDAPGLPIGRTRREENAALIATLGLDEFPHAQH